MNTRERILDRVAVDAEGCWVWQAYRDRDGYGQTAYLAGAGRQAHRVTYVLFVGPIPEGMTVDHLCFNRACCNPQHLDLAPLGDNSSRKQSTFRTHCGNGHEFTPENTRLRRWAGRTQRVCRACHREASRRLRERKAA